MIFQSYIRLMKEIVLKLEKYIDAFMNLVSTLAGYVVGLFMAILFLQVFMRFAFNRPIFGLDELVTALMIWSMALGSCVVYWANEHAVIEFLMKKAPLGFQRFMYHVTNLIVVVTSYVYIPGGITLFKMQNRLMPVGGLPFTKAWYYALPVTVMGVLLLALALFKTIGYIITHEDRMVAPVTGDEGGITLD